MEDNNTGIKNSGDYNSGNHNSGYYNSGYYNSGDYNSGDCNSGDYNSSDYNSGDYNSGLFNTNEPKMRMFNKESDITYSEWCNSNGYIYFNIPLNTYKDGELVTLEYKEAWAKWWEENKSEVMISRIKRLPNFNAEIFEEITGIEIDKKEEMIEINGKKWSKSTITEALKRHAK